MVFNFIFGVTTKVAVWALVVKLFGVLHVNVPTQHILVVGPVVTHVTFQVLLVVVDAVDVSSQQTGLGRGKRALVTLKFLCLQVDVFDVGFDVPGVARCVVTVLACVWPLVSVGMLLVVIEPLSGVRGKCA